MVLPALLAALPAAKSATSKIQIDPIKSILVGSGGLIGAWLVLILQWNLEHWEFKPGQGFRQLNGFQALDKAHVPLAPPLIQTALAGLEKIDDILLAALGALASIGKNVSETVQGFNPLTALNSLNPFTALQNLNPFNALLTDANNPLATQIADTPAAIAKFFRDVTGVPLLGLSLTQLNRLISSNPVLLPFAAVLRALIGR